MRARFGKLTALLALATSPAALVLALAPLPAWAETAEPAEERSEPHTLTGAYLAGRMARNQNDNQSAAEYYRDALFHDPKNERLLEQAFLVEAGEGNWVQALELAGELTSLQPQHRLSRLSLGLGAFKAGDYKTANDHFRAASNGAIGELTSALAMAWVKLAQNDPDGAIGLLDMPKQADWAQFFLRYHRALIADISGRRAEAKSSFEKAFRQDDRSLRTALAFARSAAHAGETKSARTIINEYLDNSRGEGHPLAYALRDEIDAGGKVELLVGTPSEGIAEAFYGLGEALIGEGAVSAGVLYLQMALYLEPQHAFSLAALANAHETNKRFEDAIAVYDRIPKGTALEPAIEIRKSLNLNSLERVDDARQILNKLLEPKSAPEAASSAEPAPVPPAEPEIPIPDGLLKLGSRGDDVKHLQAGLDAKGYKITSIDGAFGDTTRRAVIAFQKDNGLDADGIVGPETFRAVLGLKAGASAEATAEKSEPRGPSGLTVTEELQVLDAMGNILRSRKLYGEAVGYYDRAIGLIPKPDRRHWSYYYARGTSYERMKNWPAAEADLQKALQLYPDQPLVLNYLGYSWIDQGQNMKEGMALIEKAVALKPDDGYVVDSLGWAHYKQGNYPEAVRYLERAVELKPDDPVLNDHLGDALWKVGREREARFQWDQALSLKPEPEDVDKIKKKLEQGLTELPAASAEPEKHAADGQEKKAQ